ncbi:HNH endonuclease [Gordonia phage AnClar]|nr:HNH endonuclease [Gordonia phage AnClar]
MVERKPRAGVFRYAGDVAEPTRWEPDEHIVAAARAGRLTMADLDSPDRAWVVAHLTAEGMTAADAADRLSCSVRLIKTVRADPMTAVVALLIAETAAFEGESRLLRSELAVANTAAAQCAAETERLRAQVARLVGERSCNAGHELTPWNSYRRPDGRIECRQCIAARSRRYRQNRHARRHDGPASALDVQAVAPQLGAVVQRGAVV